MQKIIVRQNVKSIVVVVVVVVVFTFFVVVDVVLGVG